MLPDGTWAPDTCAKATVTVVTYTNDQQQDLTTATQSHSERTDTITQATTATSQTNVQHTQTFTDTIKSVIQSLWLLFLLYIAWQIISRLKSR